jgi:hypothetical protein
MITAMDQRSAARILDLAGETPRPRGSRSGGLAAFALILLLAAHGGARSGFPQSAQSAAMSPAGARQASKAQAGESPEMKRLMAIGAAAAMTAGASAQDAVQWRVEDGGNGHWYARVLITTQMSRKAFVSAANALGAQPVALSSNAEELFVFSQLGDGLLGLSAAAGSSAFTWMTDPSNAYSNWGGSGCDSGPYPNNPLATERFAWLQSANYCFGTQGTRILWDDFQPSELPPTNPILIEWSADCNNDGLVDYGQIRAGQLADANGNNIPDCCENGGSCCPGDTNNDQSVDGIDLATVLTRWGMPGAKFPQADCNGDGVIDGSDLAIVLAGWGGCA